MLRGPSEIAECNSGSYRPVSWRREEHQLWMVHHPPLQGPEPLVVSGGRHRPQKDEPSGVFHSKSTTAGGSRKWTDLEADRPSCCNPSMTEQMLSTVNWKMMLDWLRRITSHRRWVTFQIQYLFALGFLLVFVVLCSRILLSVHRPPMCDSSLHSLHSSARGTWAIKEVKTFAYLAFQMDLAKKLCVLCTTFAKPRNWNSTFPKVYSLPNLKTRESNNRPTTALKAIAFPLLLPWSFI